MSDTKQVSVSRVIDAPAEAIFAVVADARRHADFDGSGSVKGATGDPEPLVLGSQLRHEHAHRAAVPDPRTRWWSTRRTA